MNRCVHFILLVSLRKGIWAADGGAFAHREDSMSKQRANDEAYPPDRRESRAAKVGGTGHCQWNEESSI